MKEISLNHARLVKKEVRKGVRITSNYNGGVGGGRTTIYAYGTIYDNIKQQLDSGAIDIRDVLGVHWLLGFRWVSDVRELNICYAEIEQMDFVDGRYVYPGKVKKLLYSIGNEPDVEFIDRGCNNNNGFFQICELD